MYKTAYLDTGFLIRLLNGKHPQHQTAVDYFRYIQEKSFLIRISTIVVAEYCVKGEFEDLPTDSILLSPFNASHAVKAGVYGKVLYGEKSKWIQEKGGRTLLKNDAKIMAHADSDKADWYITFDKDSRKLYDVLRGQGLAHFHFIDANQPLSVYTGELPFDFSGEEYLME